MSDLVKRLRGEQVYVQDMQASWYEPSRLCQEAADEIERLRAEIVGLEAVRKEQAAGRDYWRAEHDKMRAKRDALQSRIDEVREIYAGMDGFIPQTAPDGYLLLIVKQMYDAAMAEKRGT